MKNIILKLIPLFFIALFANVANAQECLNFHRESCNAKSKDENSGYKYNEASRSGLLFKGQKSEFRFEIHQGKDYRIAICADPVLGSRILFQIVDAEENNVLYDNKDDNFANEFEFSVLQSRRVKIIVEVPAGQTTQKSAAIGVKPKNQELGCVGVLIESMITPKTGF